MTQLIHQAFTLWLGVATGAGLYETRNVLPLWFPCSNTGRVSIDKQRIEQMDVGRRFWGPVTTVPLTLLTLGSIYCTHTHVHTSARFFTSSSS